MKVRVDSNLKTINTDELWGFSLFPSVQFSRFFDKYLLSLSWMFIYVSISFEKEEG